MIPSCEFGFIGGSSTLGIDIPGDLGLDYVHCLEKGLVFETPFGPSPDFMLLEVISKKEAVRVLTCRMHGWRDRVSRADASRQIFWVFRQAGVSRVIAEGGVGAVNHLLKPRDLVIPNDYIDASLRRDVSLDNRYLLIMREALCPEMRRVILGKARQEWGGYVFERGIYVNTDGRHFESPAEVQGFKLAGSDVVGQSLCPEVYLAREIGACYAGVYMVVNYAEGIVEDWQHEELEDIFINRGIAMGRLISEIIRDMPSDKGCGCAGLRKQTLLTSVYNEEV